MTACLAIGGKPMFWVLLAAPLLVQEEPQPRKIMLREAVMDSLRNNPDLEVLRFSPWIHEQAALGLYGAYDTILFSEGSANKSVEPTTSLLSGAGVLEQEVRAAKIGLRRLFSGGLLVELTADSTRTKTNSTFSTLNPNWRNRLGLSVTLPLLRNPATEQELQILVQQRRHDRAIHEFEVGLQDAVFSALTAYYEVVFARGALDVARENLRLARQLVSETRERHRAGQVARVQLTEAQVQEAIEERNVLEAKRSLENAIDRLVRLIDPKQLQRGIRAPDLLPTDGPLPPEPFEERAAEEALRKALEKRPELLAARRAITEQEAELHRRRLRVRPRLDMTATAGYVGIDESFGRAHESFRSGDFYDLGLFVVFELPLENRTERHALTAAELELQRRKADLRRLTSLALVDVRDAVRRVRTDLLRIRSAEEQVRLARERLEAEQARFRQGLTTTFFVNTARRDLQEAQLALLRARIDYTIARYNVLRATGTLLQKFGIQTGQVLQPGNSP